MFKDKRLRASALCLITELLLGGFRCALAMMTGSLALMADGVHALSDVWVSFVLFFVLMFRVSNDRSKKFSPKLINYVESSAVIFSAIAVLFAAVAIFDRLYKTETPQIEYLWLAIAGTAVVMVVIYFLAKLKQRVGRETNSVTLEADGYHSKADLITSAAVLLSLVGSLAGIHLDKVLAVIIAAMIALLGVEMLVSGLRSLISSQEFDQLSLIEWCGKKLSAIPFVTATKRTINATTTVLYKLRYVIASGVVLAYAVTAVSIVPLGYVGQKVVLAKQTQADLPVGAYLHAPWPFAQINLIRDGDVRKANVGLIPSAVTQRVSDGAWFSVSSRTRKDDNTGYLHTGDQNLVFVSGELLYRVTSPTKAATSYPELDTMVTELANSSLWELVSRKTYLELIQGDRQELADQLNSFISRGAEQLNYPIEIVSFSFESIQPPGPVVNTYRKLLQARQLKVDKVNQALTEKYFQLSAARANAVQIIEQDKAYAHAHNTRAEGDITRFNSIAQSYNRKPEAYKLKLQTESFQRTLSGRPLTIADPRFDKHDYRIWSAKQ
ncbi:cation transporter [Shewanella sp. WXL01]|uniref:cation transporter n=1 Tax=Shewanella sp. WXL01 TaxID=2709721 RepID=UPI001438446F|nr:cation transporter [Shewanella sp. WXL01]NKF49842.1 cation transporter [Shewanella sp. WXL01]